MGELVGGVLDPPIGAVIASALRNSDLNTVFAAIALSALIGFALFGLVSFCGRLVLGSWHSSVRRTAVVQRREDESAERLLLVCGGCILISMTIYAFVFVKPSLKGPNETVAPSSVLAKKVDKVAWETVSIQLNWVPEPEFGGIYAAEKFGYFAEEKLKVKIIKGGPGIPSPQLQQRVRWILVSWAGPNCDDASARCSVGAIYACFDRFPRGIVVHEEGAPVSLKLYGRVNEPSRLKPDCPVKWLNSQHGKSVHLVPVRADSPSLKRIPAWLRRFSSLPSPSHFNWTKSPGSIRSRTADIIHTQLSWPPETP